MKSNRFFTFLALLLLLIIARSGNAQCNLSPSAIVTDVACFGEPGSIDLTVAGGTAPYGYMWSNGATDEDITDLTPGLYVVTITDAMACVTTLARTIVGPSDALSLVLNDDGILTCAHPGSTITPDISGGTLPYTFAWSNGATSSSLTVGSVGTYGLTITDANGCTISGQRTIAKSANFPVADAGPDNQVISCATAPNIIGGPNTTIGPDFTYHWRSFVSNIDPGVDPNQPFIEVTTFGDYRLTVRSISGGCEAEDVTFVTEDGSFPVVQIQNPGPLPCINPLITLNATGSSSGAQYQYNWTTANGNIIGGQSTLSPAVDQAGDYILTVTNLAQGCSKSGIVTVIDGQDAIVANAGPDTGLPCGNGQVTLDGSGSSSGAQYVYTWQPVNGNIVFGGTSLNPVVDVAGIYRLEVTDTNTGCSKTDEVQVFAGTLIPDQDFFVLDVSCTGQLGVVGVTMSQGTSPYTYLWSDGTTEDAIINVLTGTYTVSVTDATGCLYVGSAVVKQGTTLFNLSAQSVNPTCPPGNNGSIDLTVSGSIFGALSYLWSSGVTTQDINFLNAGVYTVTVSDQSTCTTTLSTTLTQPFQMSLSFTTTKFNNCVGISGWIDLTVTGGVQPLSYAWSDGEASEDAHPVGPGGYFVTITDALGCTASTFIFLGSTPDLNVDVAYSPDICAGNNPSSATVQVSGGQAPYTFLWDNAATDQTVLGLLIGTHFVTVTDAVGCSSVASVDVTQNSGLVLSATHVAATCGNSNGSIDLSVDSSAPPFNYLWSNNATTEDLNGLPAGTYDVTVINGLGCSETASITVEETGVFTLNTAVTNTTCSGGCNGTIDLTVTNGSSPYLYLWSNGETNEDIQNLCTGNYTVTVQDASGCTVTTSASIGINSPIVPVTMVTNVRCFGGNDGAIDLSVSGGMGPYTYSWMTNATVQDIDNLVAGVYTCTITDASGCTQTASATVDQASAINVSSTVQNVSCFGGSNGNIDITVSGGTPGYTYVWSNSQTTQDLINLVAGTYTVTLTDVNDCTKTASATVNQPTSINITNLITNIACFGGNNGSIDITVNGGVSPYTYQWSTNANTQDLVNIAAGTYTVTVIDANSCTKTASATVNQPTNINITHLITNVACFGGNNGSIDVSVNGGVAPYTYHWSTNATTQDLISLAAGTYTVTVTDVNGCTNFKAITVTGPAPFTFNITSISSTCNSETITGPDLPGATYLWTGPNGFSTTTNIITATNSGIYSLTITNPAGCTGSNSYTVTLTGGANCSGIKGRVFHDTSTDCAYNFGEPGLDGWIVRAEGATDTLYGVTNAQGRYVVSAPPGLYAMKVLIPNGLWEVCPGAITALVTPGDTVAAGDAPVQSIFFCPALTVNIGTDKLKRCNTNQYHVAYCNQGTQPAQDAYVTVILDQYMTVMGASIPYVDAGPNVLHFDLGTVGVGKCGDFDIQVFVNCNATLGQTHCTEASIYPDTLCAPFSPNWSGANLDVSSVCMADSLHFSISNTGKAGMATTSEYIVVEDGVMFRKGTLPPLNDGESMDIVVPANGSTWRVEVNQEPFNPNPSPVGLSVEGCTSNSSFSTGFVNQFPYDDESPSIDKDCTVNVSSFDPNDKQGFPMGYGAAHLVRPGTEIEYLVRFQNTGTDTAYQVRIVDTLSSWLDPSTVRFGSSSHPYRYDLDGEGVVHFIFENILLPDSNVNESASHGFVRFSIKPRPDATLDALIENTAAIYFDGNDPVFTNTSFHQLGENFITVGIWQPVLQQVSIAAYPNPFNDQTLIEVKGLRTNGTLCLEIFDLQGNKHKNLTSDQGWFRLNRGDIPAGAYLFRITQNGILVGNGKLMAE